MIEWVYLIDLLDGKTKVFQHQQEAIEWYDNNLPLLVEGSYRPHLKARYDLVIECSTPYRSTGNDQVISIKSAYAKAMDVRDRGITLQHPAIQARLDEGHYVLVDTRKTGSGITYRYTIDWYWDCDGSDVETSNNGTLGCSDINCSTDESTTCVCNKNGSSNSNDNNQMSTGYSYDGYSGWMPYNA